VTTGQEFLVGAIEVLRDASTRDPLNGRAHHDLGVALEAAGLHVDAESAYRMAREVDPERDRTHGYLSLTLVALGRQGEAIVEAEAEPSPVFRSWALAIVHEAGGDRAESDEWLERLIEEYDEVAPLQIAEVCARRDEAEDAFEWLERAYEQRDDGLIGIGTNPNFRSLHDDARWAALLRRVR
jgi:tetratricopeptide (TPR) repeat protein